MTFLLNVSNRITKVFSAAILLLAFFSNAHAYYLENALPGTITVSVKGACAIPAFSANAYYADIHTDERVLLGRGLVTAAGQLIALQEKRSDIAYTHVLATGEKSETDYIDYVNDALRTYLLANSANCTIELLEPTANSKVNYRWNTAGGTMKLRAGFAGYEKNRCYGDISKEYCLARRIRGDIQFKGAWREH